MSILDDTKRAVNGAKSLLAVITQTEPLLFEQDLENYAKADGIIGANFLEDMEKAKAFLSQLRNASDLDGFFDFPFEFQMAFLEYLLQEESYEILPALLEKSSEKVLKKQIARRIHELKTRGVNVEKEKKKHGVTLKLVQEPQPPSIVSESTGSGEREIFYASKHPRSGIRILYFVESFYQGILDFQYFETSRSGLRDMAKKLRQDGETATFEVEQPIGYYFLEQAKNRNEGSGRALPSRFLTVLNEISKSDTAFDHSPIWDHISRDQVDNALTEISNSANLHDFHEFRNWYLPPKLLKETEKRFSDILHSTVLVDARQKDEMIEQLVIETIDGYFDDSTRISWIRRIEDAAYLIYLENHVDQAIGALAVARALSQSGRPPSSIPFCEHLLSKLIKKPSELISPEETKKEPPKKDGGIILP